MPNTLQSLVYGLALALMTGWLLAVGRPVFAPLVVAILIVCVISGLAGLMARAPLLGRLPEDLRRALAAVLMVLALLEIGALFLANMGALSARAPALQQALLAAAQQGAAALGLEREPTWTALREEVLGRIDLPGLLRSAAASASGLVAALFLVTLNAVFLLLERRSIAAKLGLLSDDPGRVARIRAVAADVNDRVGRYLAVKTLMCALVGVLSFGVMTALGVEFAAFWALVIALLNYIPYIGTFIGIAFPAALTLATGDAGAALTLIGALALVQVAVGNVLEPQVMGGSLNLSPWVILVALTVWSSLWGVLGAVISVPVTAIMVVIFSEFAGTRPFAVLLSKDGRLDAL